MAANRIVPNRELDDFMARCFSAIPHSCSETLSWWVPYADLYSVWLHEKLHRDCQLYRLRVHYTTAVCVNANQCFFEGLFVDLGFQLAACNLLNRFALLRKEMKRFEEWWLQETPPARFLVYAYKGRQIPKFGVRLEQKESMSRHGRNGNFKLRSHLAVFWSMLNKDGQISEFFYNVKGKKMCVCCLLRIKGPGSQDADSWEKSNGNLG